MNWPAFNAALPGPGLVIIPVSRLIREDCKPPMARKSGFPFALKESPRISVANGKQKRKMTNIKKLTIGEIRQLLE